MGALNNLRLCTIVLQFILDIFIFVLSDRGLTIPEAKECIQDGESGDVLLGGRGDVDAPGWSRLYEVGKPVDVLTCFALGFDSSEE